MQKLLKTIGVIAIVAVIVFAMIACSGSSGSRVINSADALKLYLDSQSANSPDKPIKVTMNVNDLMIKDIVGVINAAGKYVNIDFSRSTGLTTLGESAFRDCKALTEIILPDSVTSIDRRTFSDCINLKNITVSNNITNIGRYAFPNSTNITVIGVDKSLNGTWISNDGDKIYFNNGIIKESEDSTSDYLTFYTTKEGYIKLINEGEGKHELKYSVNRNILTITLLGNPEPTTFTRQ